MLETPHVAVAVAIATKIPNPLIAIPVAFASHFVLDRIPHWNPHTYTETEKYGKPRKQTTLLALGDSVTALLLGLFVAYLALPNLSHSITIIAASFFAVLPDTSKIPFYYLKIRSGLLKNYVDFERALQVETPNVLLGVTTQILIVLVSLWWVFN